MRPAGGYFGALGALWSDFGTGRKQKTVLPNVPHSVFAVFEVFLDILFGCFFVVFQSIDFCMKKHEFSKSVVLPRREHRF